ncbi:MAG TPA: phosphoribosylglycinamide formyltransferase [Dysgonamonadaceae bacterium]|nr:phosphoribosylglycinamide formyltransferase [Dysgonamonadaceae bacterium]
MTHIALFASGNGTNAENIALHFGKSTQIKVALVVSNKPNAFVHTRAKALSIPSYSFSKQEIEEGTQLLQLLKEYSIDYIVLAGFLLKIPSTLLDNFPNKIINIHPALLPKHGGKGMYGDNVHKNVIAKGDTTTGITIHYVNEKYDDGEIIFQASCPIFPSDTYNDVAERVQILEHAFFPRIIEQVIKGEK